MNTSIRSAAPVVTIIAAACLVHIVLFRGKLDMEMAIGLRILIALAAVAVTLPLHEVIHWAFLRIFGKKDARIELARDPLGLPSLRTIAGGSLTGVRRRIMQLAPCFFLTVVPDVVFLLTDKVGLFFFIMAISNAAGCCFDIMDAVEGR